MTRPVRTSLIVLPLLLGALWRVGHIPTAQTVLVYPLDPDAFTSLGGSPFASGTYTINTSMTTAAQAASGCEMASFAPAVHFGVGDQPQSVTTGDFNADGKLDLVAANRLSDNVSVLLDNGAGGFATAVNFDAGDGPSSVTTGDFDADGNLDLATANGDSDNVSVLLGDGAGGFATAVNFGAGRGPVSVTPGDFNSDGKLDLATANVLSNNVSVLLGGGLGGFATAVNFGAGSGPLSVTTGDFDADGNLDLATANFDSDNVSVLLGDGTGGFAPAVNFAAGDLPSSVTTGDLNADGKLDLAVANRLSDNVSVLPGDGAGGFAPAVNFAAGNSPTSVTTGDFNSDGKLDLATANVLSNNVSVLLGDGLGGFAPAVNFGAGVNPFSITTGDFNSDGKLDLATAKISGNVSVLLNTCTANTAPVAQCQNVTVTAGTSCAVSASIDNGSSDPDSGDTITLTQAPPGPYALGETSVTLTAADPLGLSSSCSAIVTVRDLDAPVIQLQGAEPMTLSCRTAFVDPGATATDNCGGPVAVTPSGAVDSAVPGRYVITYSAADAANNATASMRTVTVVDTAAPTLTLRPAIRLWPPNHRTYTLTASQMVQSVSDACQTSLALGNVVIEKVTSDEPDDVAGDADGSTTGDVAIAANCQAVQVRAERDGTKNGRVYVVTLRVTDASGNTTRRDFTVSVPVSSTGGAAPDGPAQMVTSSCS